MVNNKLSILITLSLILVSTNSLSDGKWLELNSIKVPVPLIPFFPLSSPFLGHKYSHTLLDLDKVMSINVAKKMKNRCNNGFSWDLLEWIDYHRTGGSWKEEKPNTTGMPDITKYEVYEYSYNLFHKENANIGEILDRKTYEDWVLNGSNNYNDALYEHLEEVFGFEKNWEKSTYESYYSEIHFGDLMLVLSSGGCAEGEVTSKKSVNKLIRRYLDQIRDFLDDDDTYRLLK